MPEKEVEYLIKIINNEQISIHYLEENYEDILCFISRVLKEQTVLYEDESFKKLLAKTIKTIFSKLMISNEISYIEAEILLYSLYYETLNYINLQKFQIKKMEFINPDSNEIIKNRKGTFLVEDYPKNGVIYYNENNIKRMCQRNIPLVKKIDTMIATCHELIHAKQIEDMITGKLDLTTYLITLEELTNIMTKSKYYDDNYKKTILELDATLRGKQCLYNFFLTHKLFNEKQLCALKETVDGKESEIIDICIDTEFEAPSINIGRNKTKYNLINVANICVRRNEEILRMFESLSIFYGSEGTPRSLVEILKEREKNKNNSKLNQLYEYIIEFITYDYQEKIDYNPCVLDKLINAINYLTKKEYKDELEINLLDSLEKILYYPGCQPREQMKIKVKQI